MRLLSFCFLISIVVEQLEIKISIASNCIFTKIEQSAAQWTAGPVAHWLVDDNDYDCISICNKLTWK